MRKIADIDLEIAELKNLIIELINPDKIILFGSYAYGVPTEKSDIDFLVIKNGKEHTIDDEAHLATAIYYKRKEQGIRIRCDAFLENDNSVQKAVKSGGAYVDALEKGKVIYVR